MADTGRQELTDMYKANVLRPITFSEIRNMKPDKREIVQNLIKPGTAIMIFGNPACTKSLLTNLLLLNISTGKPFLDLKTKKSAVALYDNENNIASLRDRFMSIFRGLNLRRSPKNFYVFSRNGSLDATETTDQLINFCKDKKIKVIVLDTLRRVTNAEENSSSEINTFFQLTIQPLLAIDVCVIFLHHSQKGKQVFRGSSDLEGYVDAAFSVEKNGDKITIRCTKSRCAEPEKIIAEWSFEEDCFKLQRLNLLDEERTDRSKKREISEGIIHVFKMHDHLKRGEIIDLLEAEGNEYTLGSIKSSLKYLLLSRKLTKDDKNKYAIVGQEQITSIK